MKFRKILAAVLAALLILSVCPAAFAADCEHTPAEAVVENEILPTCTTSGSYDLVVYCASCGEKLSSEHKTVLLYGHVDEDEDGICDECAMKYDADNEELFGCEYCGITNHTGEISDPFGFFTAKGGFICWVVRILRFVGLGASWGQEVSVIKHFTQIKEVI